MTTSTSLPWRFRASLVRVYDGDSLWILADLGFNVRAEVELRLEGVRAPELHPAQPGAVETIDFVNHWLSVNSAPGRRWPLSVDVKATTTFEPGMQTTFSRYVATVLPAGAVNPEASLNVAVTDFLAAHPDWGHGD